MLASPSTPPLPLGRLLAAALSVCLTTSCATEPPPAPAPAPAPAEPAAAPEDTPPPPPPEPPSPLEAAETQAAVELTSPSSIEGALAKARELDTWLADHGEHEDHAAVSRVAGELRLMAVAAAEGLGTDAAKGAVGKGATTATLEQAKALLEVAGQDGAPGALAVTAALAADPSMKGVAMPRDEALELMQGDTDEAMALRILWLARLERGLTQLRDAPPEARFEALSQHAGRLLCPKCADAHHLTPDMVTRFLVNPKHGGGAFCQPVLTETPPRGPLAQAEALQVCPELGFGTVAVETSVLDGPNALAVATVRLAKRLVAMPVQEGPLRAALTKRSKAVADLLTKPVPMPKAVMAERVEPGLERQSPTIPKVLDRLGQGGLSVARDAAVQVIVDAKDVRTGLKPTLAYDGDTLRSLSADSGYDGTGLAAVSVESLMADKAEDAAQPVAMIQSALIQVTPKATELTEAVAGRLTLGSDGARLADLVVDADAPALAVARVVDGMHGAGFKTIRVARTETYGEVLPLRFREVEGELAARLGVGFERAVIVEVADGRVDAWAPAKRVEAPTEGATAAKAPPKPKPDARAPQGAAPGYKGKDLVRLRFERVEDPTPLSADEVARAVAMARFFRDRDGAGPLVHVVAGPGAKAADVLRIAHAIQQDGEEVLGAPADIWSGTACGDSSVQNAKGGAGCPRTVAVALSNTEVPSSRGIRSAPREAAKATPKAPPEPKAGPGFCDKNDIAVNMRKRTSSFRFCYERELQMKGDEGWKGRVKMRFSIGSDGKVKGEPKVASSTMNSSALHKCLAKNIKKITFGKPDGGSCVVSWPFKFGK